MISIGIRIKPYMGNIWKEKLHEFIKGVLWDSLKKLLLIYLFAKGGNSVMKKVIRLMLAVMLAIIVLTLSGCGAPECKNGCGEKSNPNCMADMCDKCCAYWSGLNGCYADHYD